MNSCLESLRSQFLEAGIQFEFDEHRFAFRAQNVAEAERVPGHIFAKSVVVVVDGLPSLLVLPAPHIVDIGVLRQQLGADVRIASEDEFEPLFPDCEVGAMPPFPGATGLPIFIDPGLLGHSEIVFEAGSHTTCVKMRTEDYLRLAKPQLLDFAREPGPVAV